MVIRRLGALSVAKVAGVLYALMGLAFGAMFSLIAVAGGFGAGRPDGPVFGVVLGGGAIVIGPVFYGCVGFVTTLIMAALYNIIAGAVGGVEIDVEQA